MRLKNKLVAAGCIAVATAALVAGVACNEHELSPFSKSLSAGKLQNVSSGSARAVDILFIVDNSSSMDNEQRSLDSNFNKFLDRLIDANADFHLATVSTEWGGNTNVSFETQALSPSNINSGAYSGGVSPKEVLAVSGITESEISSIAAQCEAYFGSTKRYISSTDEEIVKLEGEARKDYIKNLFRCEAILGTKPGTAGIERGLATAVAALRNDANDAPSAFKRNGSILAIVFVTDENDCSDVLTAESGISQIVSSDAELNLCETNRNIEDSCIVTRDDRVIVGDANTGSSLRLSSGDPITHNGKTLTTRQWCIQGDAEAREALTQRYDACIKEHLQEGEEANADAYEKYASVCKDETNIDCPRGVCKNKLNSRSYLFEQVITLVEDTNRAYYEKTNEEQFKDIGSDEKAALIRSFAKQDVIVANIINRDRGVRYETGVTDKWCGGSGNPSYRYQWFGEMFENDPIYAPICCRNEAFIAQKSGDSADDTVVCRKDDNGGNAAFGPVLGLIGKRIGEAINTICTDTAPLTCEPKDCNKPREDSNGYTNEPLESPKAACPCLYGCNINSKWAGSDREYNLCNEFRINIGTIANDATTLSSGDASYVGYTLDEDYSVDYESSYCYTRTASPIQINLQKAEAGRKLVIEYPKRVGAN